MLTDVQQLYVILDHPLAQAAEEKGLKLMAAAHEIDVIG
jgi:hypothetical protein